MATICAAFRVTPQTIKSYMALEIDPIPVIRSGRKGVANGFDIGLCFDWRLRRKLAEVRVGEEGRPLDYTAERAKLAQAQRIKIQLESEVLRGNLIPKGDVVVGVGRLVSAARSRLRSIPTQLAAVAVSMNEPEIENALAAAIDSALTGLALGGRAPMDAAAEIDGERVGGPEPAVEPGGERRAGSMEH